jgi:hypothetical protein
MKSLERERESDLGEIQKWRDLKDDFSTLNGLYIAYFSQQKKKTIQINLKEGKREAGR